MSNLFLCKTRNYFHLKIRRQLVYSLIRHFQFWFKQKVFPELCLICNQQIPYKLLLCLEFLTSFFLRKSLSKSPLLWDVFCKQPPSKSSTNSMLLLQLPSKLVINKSWKLRFSTFWLFTRGSEMAVFFGGFGSESLVLTVVIKISGCLQ